MPVSVASRFVINTKGQWLRADFAAAYLRAMADGCPEGGVSGMGAGRTQQDQEYLHDQYLHHGGPLAAWPWYTSNHIGGTALDISTGTPAQRWLSVGGSVTKATPGEKIRANEYGLIRTVNGSHNEPWHFAYDRAKDKHRAADLAARLKALGFASTAAFQKAKGLTADGVDGPLTWAALLKAAPPVVVTPPPVVIPPTIPEVPAVTDLELTTVNYNAQAKRFGGGDYSKDATFVHSLDPAILFGAEMDEDCRDAITKAAGLKVYPVNYVAVMFDPDVFTWGPKIPLTFDDKGVQAAVAVELTAKANGAKVVACSVHIRPNAGISGTAAQKLAGKKRDIAAVIKLLAKYPNVIVGGDWNTSAARTLMLAAGYRQVTPNVPTHGKDKLDAQYAKGNLSAPNPGRIVKTPASDHAATVAVVILPAPITVPTN